MFRQFTRAPLQMTEGLRNQFDKLQAVNTKLHVRVANDRKFLLNELRKIGATCGYLQAEYDFYKNVSDHAPKKPFLTGMFGVYTLDVQPGVKQPYLTALCTHGGEPFNLSQIVNIHSLANKVEAGPLQKMVELLAAGAKLVHPDDPCVALLLRHSDDVTWRTATDVAGMSNALALAGVKCMTFDCRDMSKAKLSENNDLMIKGQPVSVVIPRLDENHPTGINFPLNVHPGPKYAEEWNMHTKIEMSNVLTFASIWHRLAVKRWVSHKLGKPGCMEQFISEEEAALLRTAWPESWALNDPADREVVFSMLADDPTSLVAKNMHRPRFQITSTQNRSKVGQIIDSKEHIEQIMADPGLSNVHHAYRRIQPNLHNATIIEFHDRHLFEGDACSEVTVYSQYLRDADGKVLIDQNNGIGVRTRNEDRLQWSRINYGALSSCKVVEGRKDWDWWSETTKEVPGTALFN